MRIAINCRSFSKFNPTGIGRYTQNLIKSLARVDCEHEFWLYAPARLLDFKRRAPRPPAKNFLIRKNYFARPLKKVLQGVDVYHSPSPEFLDDFSGKRVVTVHDLAHRVFPQAHDPQTRTTIDEQMAQIAERADAIICCSQNTLDDFRRVWPNTQGKLHRVYQGVATEIFSCLPDDVRAQKRPWLLKRWGLGHYILYVGTIEPRKNLKNLLLAFAALKQRGRYLGKLAIVGMKGWMMDDFVALVKASGVQEDCVVTDYVSDEELNMLYNLADIFVYPSLYEGFGFPIVEAFRCGAAVVTAKTSSCGEIAGDAALLIDPADPQSIGEAIAQLLEDPELNATLRARAQRRAKEFSFDLTARQTLDIYEQVMRR